MQNEFKGLRHYIDIVESAQQTEDAASAGQTVGNIAGGAAGLAALPARGALAAGQWVADKAGQAWDAAKQGVSNFAGGVAQGAKQGWDATSPQSLAAAASGGAAKTPTTPEEIKAFQKANGLTPDGIIGPKTLAAMKAKGMTPPAAGQGAKPAAKPPAKPAAGAAGAAAGAAGAAAGAAGQGAAATPAAPGATTQTDDEGNTLVTTASGATGVLGPDGKPLPNGGRVTPAQAGQGAAATPAAPATPNPWEGKDPAKAAAWAKLTPNQQKWLGNADPTDSIILSRAPKNESVGYDELERLVNLVHYR